MVILHLTPFAASGKTITIAVSILRKNDPAAKASIALVLVPTREIAQQSAKEIAAIGSFLGVKVHACVGGDAMRDQQGVHIVVATPGRVHDMINRDALRLDQVSILVLDETDELLNRGFQKQIHDIFQRLPETTQRAIFSTTWPIEALDTARMFLRNPIRILVKQEDLTKQFHILNDREEWKFNSLCDLYDALTITATIIFCNTRRKVEWLAQKMREKDFTVVCLHEEMNHDERESVIQEFKSGATRVLITTDVLGGGIHFNHVSLVVNYDMPPTRNDYIRRIGNSARFGRTGITINLVLQRDMASLHAIEQFCNTQIPALPSNFVDLL